ncbi:MAG: hypothetical protein AAGE52_35125, partial [Myxococcota bacterium]
MQKTAIALALALLGCGSFRIDVSGPPAGDDRSELWLLEDAACPATAAEATSAIRTVRAIDDESDLGSLSRGRQAVAIVRRGLDCTITAYGCAIVSPKPGSSAALTLVAE